MQKPMLAHKFDKSRVDWSQPVYIQAKLDGVRCLFTKNGVLTTNIVSVSGNGVKL